MKIVVLGSNGFVGKNFTNFLKSKNYDVVALNRKNCDFLNTTKLYKILKKIDTKYIINCAGYTGKPNVDACESNKELCWLQNYTLPKNLSKICNDLNKKWVHVSSGCIYSGTKNENGFKEIDTPNFCFDKQPCSYYSGTKAAGEDILKFDKNVYICRLRIPFDDRESSKNYITKILNYKKLLNVENSMSNTDEFIQACLYLIEKECEPGIYNITNTGSINTFDVTKLLNKYITKRKFTFFKNEEEFYQKAAKTPRSNCVLDNSKLLESGFKIENIHDKIEYCIKNYKK